MTNKSTPSVEQIESFIDLKAKRRQLLQSAREANRELDHQQFAGKPLLETQRMALIGFQGWLEQLEDQDLAMGHLISPMGSGKTATAILFAEMLGGKAVFLTYTNQLGEQVIKDYKAHQTTLPAEQRKTVGRCYGGKNDTKKDFLVANFQSSERWAAKVDWSEVNVVFVDEADVNGLSQSRADFLTSLAREQGIPVIGLSATEQQSSGKVIQDIFADEILSLPIPRVLPRMRNLELAPDMGFHDVYFDLQFRVDADLLRRRQDHEADQKTVREFIRSTAWNSLMIEHYREHCYSPEKGFTKGLVVFRDNLLVENFCQQAAVFGIRAKGFTGDETPETLNKLRSDLAQGRLDLLVGSRMLGRGLHIPEARVVLNSTITFSPQLFWQANGRVMSQDPKDPQKQVNMVTFLPRYTIDSNTGQPLAPESRPLCFASFFDPDYYPPLLSRQSALERGQHALRKKPYSLNLSDVREIRSAKEVAEIIHTYHQKPAGFQGKPGLIARYLAQLSSATFADIKRVIRMSNAQLTAATDSLDEANHRPSDIGSYEHELELTLAEERHLLEDYHNGKNSPSLILKQNSEEAATRLVQAHEPVLRALANLFVDDEESIEELVQEGRVALWKSLQKFDMTRIRSRFVKFAIKGLFGHFQRIATDMKHVGHIPAHVWPRYQQAKQHEQSHWEMFGQSATPAALAEVLEESRQEICLTLGIEALQTSQTEASDKVSEWREEADQIQVLTHKHAREKIAEILKTLNSRKREVLRLKYGLGRSGEILESNTYKEIAAVIKISTSRAAQHAKGGLQRLQLPYRKAMLYQYHKDLSNMITPWKQDLWVSIAGLPAADFQECQRVSPYMVQGARMRFEEEQEAKALVTALQPFLQDHQGVPRSEGPAIEGADREVEIVCSAPYLLEQLGEGYRRDLSVELTLGEGILASLEAQEGLLNILRDAYCKKSLERIHRVLSQQYAWIAEQLLETLSRAILQEQAVQVIQLPQKIWKRGDWLDNKLKEIKRYCLMQGLSILITNCGEGRVLVNVRKLSCEQKSPEKRDHY